MGFLKFCQLAQKRLFVLYDITTHSIGIFIRIAAIYRGFLLFCRYTPNIHCLYAGSTSGMQNPPDAAACAPGGCHVLSGFQDAFIIPPEERFVNQRGIRKNAPCGRCVLCGQVKRLSPAARCRRGRESHSGVRWFRLRRGG